MMRTAVIGVAVVAVLALGVSVVTAARASAVGAPPLVTPTRAPDWRAHPAMARYDAQWQPQRAPAGAPVSVLPERGHCPLVAPVKGVRVGDGPTLAWMALTPRDVAYDAFGATECFVSVEVAGWVGYQTVR